MTDRLRIAIPLFPRFTALDAIGPYEVLQRVPTFDITFVGHARGEVRSDNGMLGLVIDGTFEDLPSPDVIVFPGGVGTRPLQSDPRVLDWVRSAHASTTFTTSVCTGSLVLGAAGLLDGLTATTHWAGYAELAAWGATPTPERVIEHLDRRIITAAGVSAGIDMALRLTELLADRTAAQAAQLMIEYDPQPSFDCGARPKAGDEVMARASWNTTGSAIKRPPGWYTGRVQTADPMGQAGGCPIPASNRLHESGPAGPLLGCRAGI